MRHHISPFIISTVGQLNASVVKADVPLIQISLEDLEPLPSGLIDTVSMTDGQTYLERATFIPRTDSGKSQLFKLSKDKKEVKSVYVTEALNLAHSLRRNTS